MVPGTQLHAMFGSPPAPYNTDFLPFKALAELSNRFFHGVSRDPQMPKAFYFHQNDLDRVLYGYARQPGNPRLCMHALSGLKVGEITHGE